VHARVTSDMWRPAFDAVRFAGHARRLSQNDSLDRRYDIAP
jgi:hypothetical protein